MEQPEQFNQFIYEFNHKVDSMIKAGLKRCTENLILAETDKAFVMQLCRIAVESHLRGEKISEADIYNVPENIKNLDAEIFVTFFKDGKMCGCRAARAEGLSFVERVLRSSQSALKDDRYKGVVKRRDIPNLTIDATVFAFPTVCNVNELAELEKEIELGVHSFQIVYESKKAFYKNSVPITSRLNLRRSIQRLCRKAGLENDVYKDPKAKIIRYETLQFSAPYTVNGAKNIETKFRVNKVYHQSDVTRYNLESAVRAAGAFMKTHVKRDGRFTYEYDPTNHSRSFSNSNVAALRRMASTWILAEVGQYCKEKSYINAAKRSVQYLLRRFYVYDENHDIGYMKIKNSAGLGMAGFALLATLSIDDDEFFPDVIEELKRFIFFQEDKGKGYLYPMYLPDRMNGFEGKQLYYPGEAMTGLMKYYDKYKDPDCLAVVENCFQHYSNVFDETDKKINMAAWMSKPYSALFAATQNEKYAEFVFRVNDFVIGKQFRPGIPYVDKIGCFSKAANSCSTGVFLESIAEGYRVAEIMKDELRMQNYSRALLLGLRFVLQSQYQASDCKSYEYPELTIGGIKTSLFDPSIRIDNVQHVSCALLRSLQYLKLQY